MKKVVKSSLLITFIMIILITLTGCEKDDSNNSKSTDEDKLVATQSITDDLLGTTYEQKMEMTFKNDKLDQATTIIECKDETEAKGMYSLYVMAAAEYDDMEVKQDGKKVVVTMGTKSVAAETGLNADDISKDNMIKYLKDEGYTIK